MSAGGEKWGPWIEWEGGRPASELIGVYVRIRAQNGQIDEGIISREPESYASGCFRAPRGGSILENGVRCYCIDAYRVRQPRGMKALREILQTAPNERVRDREDEPA
ncbi:hypothetical protein L1787_05560 [Acuticoccus sp. M5D2P5]|uniref:hypothetical protein n=1 Tax=Acuticoccus kalidii TaxID=2910977 RepID=UPI001F3ABD2E|nr:hypothetical protein [Acuticoccus kalidii]MCF3932880.1 hypothetical protein [Acuticoccus kalidii]